MVVYLACLPVLEEGSAEIRRRGDFPEELVLSQSHDEWGYAMELAIPLDFLVERGEGSCLEPQQHHITSLGSAPVAKNTHFRWCK